MNKKKKFIFMLLLCIGSIYTCCAQSGDSLLAQLSRKWIDSKAYTLKVAELMPAEDYDFKPVPEEMSFGEQLLHLADNIRWLSSYLSGPGQKEKKSSTHLKKDSILKIVSDAYDTGLAAHQRLSSGQLDEKVSFFAGKMTRRQILILMHDHQTHHVGQLIVYLRLKGIKPPEYIGW